MTNEQQRQLDLNILAVLHNAAGRWSVVVADISGPRPRISATRQFDNDDSESIDPWLNSQQVGEVLAIVPGSSVICRTCSLPDLDEAELVQGLVLQAEAHLNGSASEHRTAMAVLPAAASESNRSGLLLSWPESADIEMPELNRPVFFTADVAALSALLDNGRPNDPVLWIDRHTDVLALAMTHANGVTLRATRERAIGQSEVVRGVQRALAETALNVGHTADYVESLNATAASQLNGLSAHDAALLLPAELKNAIVDRVDGTGADNQWWSQYGIAVGALLARTGSLHTLTRMIDAPPTTAPTIVHRIVDQLSEPRTAVRVVAVAVLLIALSPLLFNGMRLMLLKLRYSGLDEKLVQVERAQDSLTMYEELEKQAWPMTKILGDIANCTPLGIELEIIRVRQGQFFTIAGKASSRKQSSGETLSATENIALMEQQLRDTNIFTEVFYTWGDPTANGQVEFDLNAKIVRPFRYAQYDIEQDFGRYTHEMRRNGDPPPTDETEIASGTGDETETNTGGALANATTSNNQPVNSSNTGSLVRTNANSGDSDRDSGNSHPRDPRWNQGGSHDPRDIGEIDNRPKIVDPKALPEFYSEATISTLNRQETMSQLTKISKVRTDWRGDDDTKKKLDAQFELLMARLKELR